MPLTLADLIERAIDEQELPKWQLAEALGVTPPTISKWIRRTRRDVVPWRHWRRICKVLGISWRQWWAVAERECPIHAQLHRRFYHR